VRGRLLTLAAGLLAAGALLFTGLNFNLLQRNPEQAGQWQRHTHEGHGDVGVGLPPGPGHREQLAQLDLRGPFGLARRAEPDHRQRSAIRFTARPKPLVKPQVERVGLEPTTGGS
jgi:hypothetical protein